MWWLITIAVPAVLVVLILTVRIRFFVKFKDKQLCAFLRILFVKIVFTGKKRGKIKKSDFKIRKFRRRRDKVLKKYRIKKKSTASVKKHAGKKQRSPLKLINALKEILWQPVKAFGKYLRIDRFEIYVRTGGEDAAKAALNYGYTVQALQYLVTFLESFSTLRRTVRKSAEVQPDFAGGNWNAEADIAVSIAVWQVLSVALKALINYIKFQFSKKTQ